MKKLIMIFVMILLLTSCGSLKNGAKTQDDNRMQNVVVEKKYTTAENKLPWNSKEIFEIRQSFNISTQYEFQGYVDEFIYYCEKYNIPQYKENFKKIPYIKVTNLMLSRDKGVLFGIVIKNNNGEIQGIDINWICLYESSLAKVTVFHEIAHVVLGYKHTCINCCEIMANFTNENAKLINNWDAEIKDLFENAPIKKQGI